MRKTLQEPKLFTKTHVGTHRLLGQRQELEQTPASSGFTSCLGFICLEGS